MDLSIPLKDCAVTLCDLRLNKNIHLPENFAELEKKSINKESDFLETDELEIKRNACCRGARRKVVTGFVSKKNYKEISSDSERETEVKKNVIKIQKNPKGPKRKVVNGFKRKKNYNDTESDSEDEKENDFAEYEDKPKRQLSSYEQMIKKRCQENMEFLQSIKINEAKTSLFEAMSYVKRQKPIRKRQTETEKKSPRKSKRLANCHFEFEERKMYINAKAAATKESEVLHSPMSFKAAVTTSHKSYLKDIHIEKPKANEEFCLYDKYVLENMKLNSSCDETISTITTVSWYPSSEHLILATGSKAGNITIWNVCSMSDPLLMRIHKDLHISHLQFSPYNEANLIFSSLDGTVFCADLVQQTFFKICGFNKSCTYFDFYSASTYLVALNSGRVAIVDKRIDEKTNRMSLHTCSQTSIQTLNNHPVNRNFFITAHDNKYKLWDLRELKRKPIAQNYQHENLRSAFFSPNTGNCILATYYQPYLRMFSFNNTDLKNCIKLEKTLSLNSDANLSAATWVSEELFSVRHGVNIKGINIYSKDMQDYTYFPTLTQRKSLLFGAYSFHPKTPALASSYSLTRISVYLKK